MSEGRLEAIWVKRMKRGPMDPVSVAELVAGRGIVGNANQGGRRQVTIIERELWERATAEIESDAPPTTRRANLMVSRLPLANMRGRILEIGDCRIRIFGETKPCWQMEEAVSGLQMALRPEWRGGAFGEVLVGGEIRVGDAVRVAD